MTVGWLVKLTTNVLGTSEWYVSAAENADMAVAAVRALPGNLEHTVEVVRPVMTHELVAVKIDPSDLVKEVV